MKKGLLSFFIVSSLFFSSCMGYSTPTGLIKAPQINTGDSNTQDLKAIVQNFLPKDSVLLAQNDLVSGKPMLNLDLDNDGANEIIAFFKIQDKFEKGFIVLKKKNNNWSKIFEKKQECNSISKSDFINIVDKDTKSLLVGFLISGNSGAQYYYYTLKDGKIKESSLGWWKQFEILNTPQQNNKGFVFAAMSRGTGNIENWDVVSLNGEEICRDEDDYPSYGSKIIDYYNNLLQQYKDKVSPMSGLAWYNLIDAQVKSNKLKEALTSLDNFNKIVGTDTTSFEIVSQDKFKFLQGKAFSKLKRYEEASAIFNDLQTKYEENLSNLTKKNDKNSLYLIKAAKLDLLNIYFEKYKIEGALKENDKINELKAKALNLNILQDYNKNNGEDIIYNELDINTAKLQLEKLKQ
ncbi:hypothetical protein I6U48_11510 [Clostridium sp. PL3]|uniref:Lipoprotein n=1 Tax=Clostridium thailandense TaxID=2794346 RepID=A0A949TU82_9CLOT|nr:hypothetical protein [Clostridium thailandense]MBV7273536.1 hypothetical protein [Clostridium thailandense]